jgi:hypothetical protein
MTTLAECQKLFSLLCKVDDKHLRLQKMKYNEELGEFFREYLIYVSKAEGLLSMAHREANISNMLDEIIDCIIVSTRIRENPLPAWNPKQQSLVPDFSDAEEYFLNIANAVMEGDHDSMASNLSRLVTEKDYYLSLMRKLKKWEAILFINGLML